jgi:hypothetical protein
MSTPEFTLLLNLFRAQSGIPTPPIGPTFSDTLLEDFIATLNPLNFIS